jgi:hypothetical protein
MLWRELLIEKQYVCIYVRMYVCVYVCYIFYALLRVLSVAQNSVKC